MSFTGVPGGQKGSNEPPPLGSGSAQEDNEYLSQRLFYYYREDLGKKFPGRQFLICESRLIAKSASLFYSLQVSFGNIHHKECYFKDPEEFKPERFMDESQRLVAEVDSLKNAS